MSVAVRPVFLFSLPRSGSTLLQRLLGAHEQVATASEPWVLLPLLYALRGEGVYAEYNHATATRAIQDFYATLPDGRGDYTATVREFALGLYSKASKESTRYFLDKTPRYSLIVDEIVSTFPDAKFIFLWRNPLAVVASMMETSSKENWNLYRYKVDLFTGLENLTDACKRNERISCALRYEDLVEDPKNELGRLLGYLELPFEPSILTKIEKVKLQGRMGDRSGRAGYNRISGDSVNKWKGVLYNPVRKGWCRHYLRWIGEDRLLLMGYNLKELNSELNSVSNSLRRTGSDAVRGGYGVAYELLELPMFKRKLRVLSDWGRVHSHR